MENQFYLFIALIMLRLSSKRIKNMIIPIPYLQFFLFIHVFVYLLYLLGFRTYNHRFVTFCDYFSYLNR